MSDPNENDRPGSLEAFRFIPAELRQHIIDLACRCSSSSTASASTRSLFCTDTATARALCLASRELNDLAISSLYGDIVITRPSALYFLDRTLKACPERAKLTRRLHLGPLDALPADWWPVTYAYPEGEGWTTKNNRYFGQPFAWIKTTLSQEELPSGYSQGHAWALGRTLPSCREAAIRDAIHAAQGFFGVYLDEETRKACTRRMAGILEVQAALDLYLEGVRRFEENDDTHQRLAPSRAREVGCRDDSCQHYMSLHITGATHRPYASRRPQRLGGQQQIDRLAILRHLARPGSLTDRFDHPIIFARSGFDVPVAPGPGRGHKDHVPGRRTFYAIRSKTWDLSNVHEKHEWPDLAALQRDKAEWEHNTVSDKKRCQAIATRNDMLIKTGTVGQALRLARAVYALFSNLTDLSLTGFFEAIFDFDSNQQIDHLRRLSFGPPPPFWDRQLALSGFSGLEKLHLCGIVVNEPEILFITNEMPLLKEFQWSMPEQASNFSDELSLVGTIELLLRRDGDHQGGQPAVDAVDHGSQLPWGMHRQARHLASVGAQASSAAAAPPKQCLPNDALIIAQLNISDMLKVLAAAPSPDVAEAWRVGRRASAGQRRLLLLANSAAMDGSMQFWFHGSSSDWARVYKRGWEWWEAQCL